MGFSNCVPPIKLWHPKKILDRYSPDLYKNLSAPVRFNKLYLQRLLGVMHNPQRRFFIARILGRHNLILLSELFVMEEKQ